MMIKINTCFIQYKTSRTKIVKDSLTKYQSFRYLPVYIYFIWFICTPMTFLIKIVLSAEIPSKKKCTEKLSHWGTKTSKNLLRIREFPAKIELKAGYSSNG